MASSDDDFDLELTSSSDEEFNNTKKKKKVMKKKKKETKPKPKPKPQGKRKVKAKVIELSSSDDDDEEDEEDEGEEEEVEERRARRDVRTRSGRRTSAPKSYKELLASSDDDDEEDDDDDDSEDSDADMYDDDDDDDDDFEPVKPTKSATGKRKRGSSSSSSSSAAAAAAAASSSSSSKPIKRRKGRKSGGGRGRGRGRGKIVNDTRAAIEELRQELDDMPEEEVLSAVTTLRNAMVRSAAASAGREVTLESLNLPDVRLGVTLMPEEETRARIEEIILQVASSILAGRGFQYEVPSRSASNQLYVPQLDRIVLKNAVVTREFASLSHGRKATITTRVLQLVHELCARRIHVTKRDLFYTDVKLFVKQNDSDEVLEDVACMVGCTRSSLNVVASEKGVVVGQLRFRDDGDPIDCTRMGVGGKAIPPYIDRVTDIESEARFILLVEKDAAFMRLAEDRFYNKYPCIIITAKGQPDVATRLFLRKVQETLNIPVLGLVDSDPYGLKILSVYMSGSKRMSYDSASLTTKDIKWLGVRPSDLDRYNIPQQCRLKMTPSDIKTGQKLLEEEFIKKNPAWHAELKLMVDNGVKAEIQALSTFGFQYLTHVYLPLKLREGDWI